MATLEADFQARYSSTLAVKLTNPDAEGATTVDSTRLTNAATDVKADIQVLCGVTYDSTDARHVAAAVEGVRLRLLAYKGDTEAGRELAAWQERVKGSLGLVTGRDRVMPKTSSELTPSSERTITGETVRPDFDRENLWDYTPVQQPTARPDGFVNV